MRADAAAMAPFAEHFVLIVEYQYDSKAAAEACEQRLISEYETLGPRGYNTLTGAPSLSNRFWFMHRRGIV